MRKAGKEFERRLQRGEIHQYISDWVTQLQTHFGLNQSLPLLLLFLTDDMLELFVGQSAQHIVEVVEENVIQNILGVEFSTNPEDNRFFATNFEFTGA